MLKSLQPKATASRKFAPKAGLKRPVSGAQENSQRTSAVSDLNNGDDGTASKKDVSDHSQLQDESHNAPISVLNPVEYKEPTSLTDSAAQGLSGLSENAPNVTPVVDNGDKNPVVAAVPVETSTHNGQSRKRFKIDSSRRQSVPAAPVLQSGSQQAVSIPSRPSILPSGLHGENCPYELYTVYLRRQAEGLGLRLKNVEETPVVIGFSPSFLLLQAESQAKKIQQYDVIVGVNNVDIRTQAPARRAGAGKAGSNFEKIVAALREPSGGSKNRSFSAGGGGALSISLSTIDGDIVCITLARPAHGPQSAAVSVSAGALT